MAEKKLFTIIKVNPNKTEQEVQVDPRHVKDLLEFKNHSGVTYKLPEGVELPEVKEETETQEKDDSVDETPQFKKSLFLEKNDDGEFKMPDEIFKGHYMEIAEEKPHHSAKRENLVAKLVDAGLVEDDGPTEEEEPGE